MSDFWLNFFANFLSSAIVALVFYIAITQRSEKKTQQLRIKQFLGMLKAEWELNMTRAKHLVNEFELGHETTLTRTASRRYTRGVWNALKENSFLVQLTDARLVYYLLRANEALVVANSSLAKFQKAIGADEGENIGPLSDLLPKLVPRIMRVPRPRTTSRSALDETAYGGRNRHDSA